MFRRARVPVFAELLGNDIRIRDILIEDADRAGEAVHAFDEGGGEIRPVERQITADQFDDMRGILRK